MPIYYPIIAYAIICFVVAFTAENRRITGPDAFFLSLFFTPFIGIILVHLSERKEEVERKEKVMAMLRKMSGTPDEEE